jgi:hypothetical protein
MNGQTTFDLFITVKTKKKTFFFVDWTQEQPIATWLTKKPEKITYEVTVKWKETGQTITICCFHEGEPYKIHENTDSPIYKNVIYKSVLDDN